MLSRKDQQVRFCIFTWLVYVCETHKWLLTALSSQPLHGMAASCTQHRVVFQLNISSHSGISYAGKLIFCFSLQIPHLCGANCLKIRKQQRYFKYKVAQITTEILKINFQIDSRVAQIATERQRDLGPCYYHNHLISKKRRKKKQGLSIEIKVRDWQPIRRTPTSELWGRVGSQEKSNWAAQG